MRKILYIGGGGSSGMFSFGALSKITKEEVPSHIEAMYGTSSGVLSIAFLCSGTLNETPKAFTYKSLQKVLFLKRVFLATIQRMFGGTRVGLPKINVFELDTLMDLIDQHKLIDYEGLAKYPIPLYAILMNVDTGRVEFVDIRDNPREIIRAGINLVPMHEHAAYINDKRYVDGGIVNPVPIDQILSENPDREIILLLNSKLYPSIYMKIAYAVLGTIEGLVGWTSLHKSIFTGFTRRSKVEKKDVELALSSPRVKIVCPKRKNTAYVITKDREVLEGVYKIGLDQSEQFKQTVQS